jgi:hypothetical protein
MYRRVLFAAAVLVAGSVSVAAQTTADAVRSWIASVDQSAEWDAQYSTLTEDAANNAAIVTGLLIQKPTDGGVRFYFDTVTVRGLVANSGAGFAAEEIGINSIAVSSKYFNATLEGTSLAGLFIPAVAAAVFESDEPHIVISRIHELVGGLRLDRLRVDNIAGKYETMGESTELSYESFELSGLADGRIASITSGTARQVAQTPEGPLVSVIQRIESQSTDYGTMLRLLDPYNPPGGEDGWRTIVPLIVYRGIAWAQGETKVAIDEMSMEDFRMRKPPSGYAPAMRRLLEEQEIPESERESFGAHLAIDFLDSFALGRVSVRSLEATGPDVDRARLGGFAISDISLASIGEISLDGLEVSVPGEGSVSLDRFAIGGIVFPPAAAMRAAIDAERDGREVDPLTLLPQLAFLEFLRAKARFADMPGSLDRLRFELRDFVGGIPTAASADLRRLEIPATAITDADAREVLAGMGIERVSINYGYRVRWREADARLIVDDIHLEIEDVGALSVSLVLAGLKREMISASYDAEQLLADLSFQEARIVFEDRSATDRAIRYFAQQQGADPETLRQETADAIPLTLRIAIENDGLRAKIAPALKAFLLKPGRLTVTLRAKEPLPLAALVAVAGLAPDTLTDMVEIDVQQE